MSSNSIPAVELVSELGDLLAKLPFKDEEFWDIYYRHNNYFLEKNASLMPIVKNNSNFLKASNLNTNEIGFEKSVQFYNEETNELSRIGIRVCSLLDIIKAQASLKLPLNFLNNSVKLVSTKFKVETEIVERVFRASEETLSMIAYKYAQKPLMTRMDCFKVVLGYLGSKDGLSLILVNKEHHSRLKDDYVKAVLYSTDSLSSPKHQELRIQIWWSLLPRETRAKKMASAEEAAKELMGGEENIEDLIEMDLKRSMNYFQPDEFQPIKRILLNIAANFKSLTYYQGMNYIAIFLLHTFKDELKAYCFFYYLTEAHLCPYFNKMFGGMMRLIWASDKMIQIYAPELWDQLRKGQVSSLHFSTANIITLFSCLVKGSSSEHVLDIWELMFTDGIHSIIKSLVYLLDLQKPQMSSIEPDLLLLALKNVDSDPFAVLSYAKAKPSAFEAVRGGFSKKRLREAWGSGRAFEEMLLFYQDTVRHIHEFWE